MRTFIRPTVEECKNLVPAAKEELDEFREFVKSLGKWSNQEITAWTPVEATAMAVRFEAAIKEAERESKVGLDANGEQEENEKTLSVDEYLRNQNEHEKAKQEMDREIKSSLAKVILSTVKESCACKYESFGVHPCVGVVQSNCGFMVELVSTLRMTTGNDVVRFDRTMAVLLGGLSILVGVVNESTTARIREMETNISAFVKIGLFNREKVTTVFYWTELSGDGAEKTVELQAKTLPGWFPPPRYR